MFAVLYASVEAFDGVQYFAHGPASPVMVVLQGLPGTDLLGFELDGSDFFPYLFFVVFEVAGDPVLFLEYWASDDVELVDGPFFQGSVGGFGECHAASRALPLTDHHAESPL